MTKPAREDRGVEKRGNHPVPAGHAQNWPNLIFEKLRQFEVRHVAYVPDAGHAQLIELCQATDGTEPTVLTTEEEGIGILAGAWLGGERDVLLMKSSGVGNCINTLSLVKVCGFTRVPSWFLRSSSSMHRHIKCRRGSPLEQVGQILPQCIAQKGPASRGALSVDPVFHPNDTAIR